MIRHILPATAILKDDFFVRDHRVLVFEKANNCINQDIRGINNILYVQYALIAGHDEVVL